MGEGLRGRLARWWRRWANRQGRDDAVAVAKAYAAEKGWGWREPTVVNWGLRYSHVMSNANCRGGNVNVHVDRLTGKVRRAGFARH